MNMPLPPAPPAPAPPAPPKRKRHFFRWVLLALAVMIGLSIASNSSKDSSTTPTGGLVGGTSSSAHPPIGDIDAVTIGSVDSIGYLHYTVKVTNHSSKASDYTIKVACESGDKSQQFDTDLQFISSLGTDQSTSKEGICSVPEHYGSVHVQVLEVDRHVS